jgi:O-acetyl-ADP-ribose deacetylase (regulator of RNase III)
MDKINLKAAPLKYVQQNITTVTEGVVGHQVNCRRAMNSGVARAIRQWQPAVFDEYVKYCRGKTEQGLLGKCHIVPIDEYEDLFVANIFGQGDFGYDGGLYTDLKALEQGLNDMYFFAHLFTMPVYLPKIGSGLGGADWDTEVAPIIERINNLYPTIETTICTI